MFVYLSNMLILYDLTILILMIVIFVVACVQRCGDRPPPIIECGKSIYCGKYGETRNSLSLSGEKWNGSRHLVVWSLGTLTGLRDWVRRLVK